jgi:hypothetical protein
MPLDLKIDGVALEEPYASGRAVASALQSVAPY